MQTIILSIQQHNNEERLFAGFPYDKNIITLIKEIPGARWSHSTNNLMSFLRV